jgi:hypothetical protein
MIAFATSLGWIIHSSTYERLSVENTDSNNPKPHKRSKRNPPKKQEFEVEECLPSYREHHGKSPRFDR